MTDDQLSASKLIDAPADGMIGVLADQANHAAIDGTGWVREPFRPFLPEHLGKSLAHLAELVAATTPDVRD